MIRCIAVDDEPLALELLEDNISKVPYLELVASCNNVMEAMAVLEKNTVDLIFLDIQMPGITGLQWISSMREKPMIIMITAYEKFALEGFNQDVVDYLVKPVPLERFIKACQKAKELHSLKTAAAGKSTQTFDFIFVPSDYSMLKVVIGDIRWIEGLKDYIRINLFSSSKPIITRFTMKNIEDLLPAREFLRIHKSYIVAVSAITAVRKSSVFLNDLELPVSDNYRDELQALLGNRQ
ncbi:LytTR family DNA-binding domain-containing protein [Pollutibacter soli]|uniref:LytR/AlgR family response regulator transcription factor n=1 Tax=Pollutibacter soli TaxID=3034157 RepID=UPI003013633C